MSWLLLYNLLAWTLRIVMLLIILRRRLPHPTKLAWLVVVFLLPELGLFLYVMFGHSQLVRRRVERHRNTIAAVRSDQRMQLHASQMIRPELDPSQTPMILQAEHVGGMPIVAGNDVTLISRSDGLIDHIVDDIDHAKHHVHLLFYIVATDHTAERIIEALIRARQRGIAVRFLADAAGSRKFLKHKQFAGKLRDADIDVIPMLPVNIFRRPLTRVDLRNHRKLVVIDGRIGYAGSQNIVDPDYGHKRAGQWIDLSGRFVGPMVNQLQQVFLEDWAFDTGEELAGDELLPITESQGNIPAQVVPTGPSHESETFRTVLLAAINVARERVILTSPYLVLDEPTQLSLTMAADRGVSVNIVLPGKSDHPLVTSAGRACYERLLESGVRIYRYQKGMLHAKTITVDNSFALLGSSNIDLRSFDLNFEISVLLYGDQITEKLRNVQMQYIQDSSPIDLQQWQNRPVMQRYLEETAALLSPLL